MTRPSPYPPLALYYPADSCLHGYFLCSLSQDESEDYVAMMWHKIAKLSRDKQEQLAAFQQAIENLKVSVLISLLMWSLRSYPWQHHTAGTSVNTQCRRMQNTSLY